jgi:UDP-glucose 4-epimerase
VSFGERFGLFDFSDDFRRLLRYGRAVDVTRLVEEVGYRPRYTSVEAVRDYVAKQGGRRLTPPLRQVVRA